MSILNVNTIQPIGSGTTVTVAATELKTSNFITVGTGASVTSPSANVLTLGTNTAERLRITSAGLIGIGTDNPGTKLDVRGGNWANGDIVVGQLGNAGRIKFRRGADGSDSAFIGFAAADNNSRLSIGVDSGDGTIAFQTNSAERLRVDSSGRLLVGHTSSVSSLADVKIEAVSGAGAEIHLARNDSSVTDGNSIGILRFYGNDGGTYQECARINCQADGTHADGDKPSRLTFYTTTSGAQTSAERLRITSGGLVGINDTSPDANLSVGGSTAFIDVGAAGGNRAKIGYSSNDCIFGVSATAGEFLFKNNVNSTDNPASSGTTRMRITGSGHVLRPTMAAAAVTLSGGSTTLSTFNTSYQILSLNSEGYDNANNFNTTNYRFTAPETGFYQVGCNIQLENGSGSNTNNWMYIYPVINGNAPGTAVGGNQADFDPTDTYYYSWNWSALLKLSQNDYIEWKYRGNLTSVVLKGQGESIFYFYQVG